jgi:hypothetical protein
MHSLQTAVLAFLLPLSLTPKNFGDKNHSFSSPEPCGPRQGTKELLTN